MSFKKTEQFVKDIKNLIRRNRISHAIQLLEEFIEFGGDETLSDEIVLLTARYNREIKNKRLGIKVGEEIENQIIDSLLTLLKEAKEVAFDKVTIKAGSQLENLTSRGEETIKNLEKINFMIAKSRILELEVMTQGATAMLLSKEHKDRIIECIDSFNNLIQDLEKN